MTNLRPKKCKDCKKEFQPFKSLQPRCFTCAVKKGKKDGEKQRKKAQEAQRKEFNKETRKRKEKLRTRSDWLEGRQAAFNRFIRARDRLYYIEQGKPPECISCETTNPTIQYCAGHLKTRGAFPELAIDEENCHLQCNRHCNRELSGNINGDKHSIGYLKGMEKRYGKDKAKEIIDRLNGPTEPEKADIETIREQTRYYNRKARELERRIEDEDCDYR